MNQVLQSYRSLRAGQKVLVGGVAFVLAIVLLVNLPHILAAMFAFALGLIVLGFCALALVGFAITVFFVVRALRPHS